jgi:hypothetical protein
MMTSTKRRILDSGEAAEYLGREIETLANWRYKGFGPPYIKADRKISYLISDLDEWLNAHRVEPERAREFVNG